MARIRVKTTKYHPHQGKVIKDKHRIKIVICGTKYGKTWGFLRHAMYKCLAKPGQLIWWVAPTYRYGKVAWLETLNKIWPVGDEYRKGIFEITKGKDPIEIQFNWWTRQKQPMSRIVFMSAENPDSLKASGVHEIFGDEPAMWREAAFHNCLTTLSHTRGNISLFTTPKGKGNWLFPHWLKGWDGDDDYPRGKYRDQHPAYMSYRAPTWTNPTIEWKFIEEMRQAMPERLWMQEFGAFWIDSHGEVFRNIKQICCLSRKHHPNPRHIYVLGWDPAQSESKSFSGWSVIDISVWPFQEVDCGRMDPNTPWPDQWNKIKALHLKWNKARVIYDDTGGSGKGVHWYPLRDRGIRSIKFDFAGKRPGKTALVKNMISAFDQLHVRLIDDQEFTDEIEGYGYNITLTDIKYGAPEGCRDDVLDARMLAFWQGCKMNPKGRTLLRDAQLKEAQKIKTRAQIREEVIKVMKSQISEKNRDFLMSLLYYNNVMDPDAFLDDPQAYLEAQRIEHAASRV